mgnify:CR=1 FL=1
MGIVMLVQSCVTLTKTMRDMHESGKLVNRIEDAKAERAADGSFQGGVSADTGRHARACPGIHASLAWQPKQGDGLAGTSPVSTKTEEPEIKWRRLVRRSGRPCLALIRAWHCSLRLF